MRIRLATTAGFCMGVRRAVDIALDLRRTSHPMPIVTYGPLIHNPQTLELLSSRGIGQISSIDEVNGGTVVIRAHGISPQERLALESKGAYIIDATCPRVAMVQTIIRKHAAQGRFCVIVGDEDHPEVRGLLGFASAGGVAIASPEDTDRIAGLPRDRELCVVAQTTQDIETLNRVVEELHSRSLDLKVHNTICDSTKKRQAEVGRLASQSDLIVVVGGMGSANTRRLAKVAEAEGVRALHVETAEGIKPEDVWGAQTVGVTAGASTPNWQIQNVIDRVRQIGMSRGSGLLRRLRRMFDITVMTYFWAAAAGGGLTAACLALQGIQVTLLPLALAMLFVFSMHLLNRIIERSGAVRFNTPEIAAFYARHRVLLTILGAASSGLAIALSFRAGLYTLLTLSAMIVAGLLYTVPLLSESWGVSRRELSLKEIPGSKTPFVALGWALAAVVLPVVEPGTNFSWPALVVAFLFAASLIFWRTALSDLMDIQGDRIVGRETIPILLGAKKTREMLRKLLIFLVLLPVVPSLFGWTTSAGYLLALLPVVLSAVLLQSRKGQLVDRFLFEALLDGSLFLAGIGCAFYAKVFL